MEPLITTFPLDMVADYMEEKDNFFKDFNEINHSFTEHAIFLYDFVITQ
jgi:hypothetical protein